MYSMKKVRWDLEKAKAIRNNPSRMGVGFEECAIAIENNKVLDVVENPSSNHPDQNVFVLEIGGYAYSVPFIETETELFLKTVFPSRKYTLIYLRDKDHE